MRVCKFSLGYKFSLIEMSSQNMGAKKFSKESSPKPRFSNLIYDVREKYTLMLLRVRAGYRSLFERYNILQKHSLPSQPYPWLVFEQQQIH